VFQHTLLPAETLFATPGLYCLRWEDVDQANFVWLKFNHFVGTTPIPQYEICVYCDEDDDCELDDNEGAHPDGGIVDLLITPIDCDIDIKPAVMNPTTRTVVTDED